MNWEKKLAIAVVCLALLAVAGFHIGMGYTLVMGPRMRIQTNVRTYQAEVPALPEGVVPVGSPDVAPYPRAPGGEQSAAMTSPVSATPESLERGKVYYQYYCVFCHGDPGDGNGPVGQSYVPKPTDLRTPKIGAYSEGKMLRAMLVGVGHEPVLEKVVPPEHRWCLVQYVRSLAVPAVK